MLPIDARMSSLSSEISSRLSIPSENQKLIFRGITLPLSDEPLSQFKIKSGTKLLLLAPAESDSSDNPNIKSSVSRALNRISRHVPSIADSMEYEPHKSIILKGKPPGVIDPHPIQTSVIPSTPFIVYNQNGVLSELSIETDALFLNCSDKTCERIFFSDIYRTGTIQMPWDHSGYFALGLYTSNGMKWMYFIPQQYRMFFRGILQ